MTLATVQAAIPGDASEFTHTPLMEVKQEEGRFIIRVTRCVSIAHVIATVAIELSKVGKPPEIHFGWSNQSPIAANLSFLFLGEGNVPWMVRELIADLAQFLLVSLADGVHIRIRQRLVDGNELRAKPESDHRNVEWLAH